MTFFHGIGLNLRGLRIGLRNPRLLFLGLVRFVVIIAATVACAWLVLAHHGAIMQSIWARPESAWVVWLWHLLSWLLTLVLIAVSAVVAFLVGQILFSVVIMEMMSRITERMTTGRVEEGQSLPLPAQFLFLVQQEIPRAVIPVLIALVLMVLGWLTPLSPVVTVISPLATVVFLAWDNTDLVPARRLEPFGARFRRLARTLPFHLGFGLWFLIPGINALFLSFAPVGATLFAVEEAGDALRRDPPESGTTGPEPV